jgi:hypothetical protein
VTRVRPSWSRAQGAAAIAALSPVRLRRPTPGDCNQSGQKCGQPGRRQTGLTYGEARVSTNESSVGARPAVIVLEARQRLVGDGVQVERPQRSEV